MKKTLTLIIPALALLFGGCASIVEGQNQPVSVRAIHEGKNVSGAECEIMNDEGTWYITTPGSAVINRSAREITIICRKEGYADGIMIAKSSVKGMAFGNLLFGGIIGVGVDAVSGAAFDYPALIVVKMGEKVIVGDEDK